MRKVMIKAFVRKSPNQKAIVEAVRAALKPYRPPYSLHRRCVSGDIDYRVVVEVQDYDISLIEKQLKLLNVHTTLIPVGEG